MKSLVYSIITIVLIYVDFICSLKTEKLISVFNTHTSNNSYIESTFNNEHILLKCIIKNCFKCDTNLLNVCIECNRGFNLYDNKCFSNY
jgi:hypothetical protein